MGEILKRVDDSDAVEEVSCEGPHCKGLIYGVANFTACLGEWHTFLALNVKGGTQEIYLPDWPLILVALL